MSRYFKILEISQDEFIGSTGFDPEGYSQAVEPVDGSVYVAVDDEDEEEMSVYLDSFDCV